MIPPLMTVDSIRFVLTAVVLWSVVVPTYALAEGKTSWYGKGRQKGVTSTNTETAKTQPIAPQIKPPFSRSTGTKPTVNSSSPLQQPKTNSSSVPHMQVPTNKALGTAFDRAPGAFLHWVRVANLLPANVRQFDGALAEEMRKSPPSGEKRSYRMIMNTDGFGAPSTFRSLSPNRSHSELSADRHPIPHSQRERTPPETLWADICVHRFGWWPGNCDRFSMPPAMLSSATERMPGFSLTRPANTGQHRKTR
jgi:hypothetical protein